MPYRSTLVPRRLPASLDRVVAAFLANLRPARQGQSRGVHDARVASRRLREFLRAVSIGPAHDVRSVRRAIRRMAHALGQVREIDVSLELIASHPVAAGWSSTMRARIQRECVRERGHRQDEMTRRLAKVQVDSLAPKIRAIARAFARADRSAEAGIAARRRVRARTLREALDRAGTVYAPALLHAVRIAAKKLRYNLEWSRGVAGPALAIQLRELKAAQQLLGDIQDLHILEGALRRIAAQPALDRSTVRAIQAGAVRIEAACRERHAHVVKLIPRLAALADDLSRKTPLEWIRRRPARMSGPRSKAQGPTATPRPMPAVRPSRTAARPA